MVDLSRHARHITLPQVGLKGQQKLADASVLVVGAGGLGSPALLYLAAAGIGKIGIIDDDVVDPVNAQSSHQIIIDQGNRGQFDLLAGTDHSINRQIIDHAQKLLITTFPTFSASK